MTDSVLAKYVHTLVDAVQLHYGLDAEALYELAGVPALPVSDEAERVSAEVADRLWLASEKIAEDGLLGLRVGQTVSLLSYASLGHLLLTCSTIGEAIETAAANTLYIGAGTFDLRREQGGLTLIYKELDPTRPAADARVTATLLPFARFSELAPDSEPPEHVCLKHAVRNDEAHKSAFGCNVFFGAATNSIRWGNGLLNQPLKGANAALKRILHQHVASEIAASVSISGKIRAYLQNSMPEDWTAAGCAAALGLSLRTLQRQLASEGSSFRIILTDFTMMQAKKMLTGTSKTVTEIALQLGYAEPAPFVRAFKRYSRLSPLEFRMQQQPEFL